MLLVTSRGMADVGLNQIIGLHPSLGLNLWELHGTKWPTI